MFGLYLIRVRQRVTLDHQMIIAIAVRGTPHTAVAMLLYVYCMYVCMHVFIYAFMYCMSAAVRSYIPMPVVCMILTFVYIWLNQILPFYMVSTSNHAYLFLT